MTSNSAPIRLGILGCGRIVTRRMLPALQHSDSVQAVGIASERAGVASEIATEHSIPNSFDSYDKLLQSSEIDAVYIPCTGDQHHRWVIAAANAGKHVLCEKPLAPSLQEAEEMVAACEAKNVVVQEAFMWRQHDRAQLVKKTVSEGAIGNLRLINVSFSFNIDRGDWRLRPERGGGAMWDLGCYGVNAARFLTDLEPVAIDAAAHWWETGVDMSMRMGLTFPGEVLANIDCSFEAPFRCRMEIVGDDGRIVVDPAFQPSDSPTFQLWDSVERDTPMRIIEADPKDQYACQLDAFAVGIQQGKLVLGAENGLQNMIVMEEILASAKAKES